MRSFLRNELNSFCIRTTLRETSPYSEFFWSYFPAFELNTERYFVSLSIQSKYEKTQAKKTPNTDTFHAVLNGYLIGCHKV